VLQSEATSSRGTTRHVLDMALPMADAGDHVRASRAARLASVHSPRDADLLRAAARIAALCTRAVQPSSVDASAPDALPREYQELTVDLLRAALAAGWDDPAALDGDPAFDRVRNTDAFRALLDR